ncbi:ACT domain-containing protein [Trueperella pecoris]|uniref:ACT domain-containing protein n=1 Tax=Trueperella pecoris TaxID=2733571 RepID=A0A7M1QZN7_9ACTO|nr:ACT domain-containing protein [Trueperella pecoris]QOR47408.1 ACT domain-containing protein [Trueperella pecoris]
MFAIITVTGSDHSGIVAAVTSALAEHEANILDISQTLMGGYFTMILRVELADARPADTADTGDAPEPHSIDDLQDALAAVEEAQNLVIRVQSEALFTAMNEL